eukprot:jgi/Mesen1/8110/ME000435S07284
MGKGGGCTPSSLKKKPPTSDEANVAAEPAAPAPAPPAPIPEPTPAPVANADQSKTAGGVDPAQDIPSSSVAPATSANATNADVVAGPEAPEAQAITEAPPAPPSTAAKVYIVYYSMYGHVARLASKIKEGVDSVPGAEGFLYQVPESLPESVLAKMNAPPKQDVPVIEARELVEADAILFGFPTRFGMMSGQMKAFLDSTGSLWKQQSLAGKPAGFFFSTGTQGGGQETTALTAISQLAHHGMLYVPMGYTFQGLYNPDTHGGSPYGAGTYAGDGTRNPLDVELEMAAHQGKMTAVVAVKLKKGLAAP